jgi:hypothetical protein
LRRVSRTATATTVRQMLRSASLVGRKNMQKMTARFVRGCRKIACWAGVVSVMTKRDPRLATIAASPHAIRDPLNPPLALVTTVQIASITVSLTLSVGKKGPGGVKGESTGE